jgi:hypothetical protein
MMNHRDSEVLLSFDPLALARCCLIADVLAEEFDEPAMEYGLLGLADERAPLHVLATPLLVGQSVSPASVEQPGRQVLRMRDEVEALSRRMRRRLVPIAFIHRHPSCCEASITDHDFLRGVFVNQVSTVVSFEEVRRIDAVDPPCGCTGLRRLLREAPSNGNGFVELRGECGVAFSLIVNRKRDHRVYAVRKSTCPFCGRSEVRGVPARITPDPRCAVSAMDPVALRSRVKQEIEAKIRFERDRQGMEKVRW